MITIDYDIKKQKGIISGDHIDIIREHFSIENPAAKFFRQRRFMPKRLYAINPQGFFDIGLIEEIKSFLAKRDINTPMQVSLAAQHVISPSYNTVAREYLNLPLRDYQLATIEACMQAGRGVVVLGTGAGKTLVCATLIENVYNNFKNKDLFKCLMVVPDLGLVTQTFNEFNSMGVNFTFTKWTGSNEPDLNANVIIANTSILQSRFDASKWVEFVDLLIVDETHKAGAGTKLSKIISKIKTHHKFGFTGTLPSDKMNQWSVIGKIGPVLYEKNSAELRNENYLTNVQVFVFKINYKTKIESNGDDPYRDELEYLKSNTYRNKVITTVCKNHDNNTLILVNHINHGLILEEHLKQLTDKKVFFIQGEVEVEEREKIKKLMEDTNNVVCVAMSSIFSTGVNIKNIHMIIFAAGGKSFIRTVQSIGRGLRLHHTKEKLRIIDIADNLKYSNEHAAKRQEIYQHEKISYKVQLIEEN